MRQVFTNREVPHLWAYGRQNIGRNGDSTLWFEGDTIYSYGRHFPIARRVGIGRYIFTDRSYSQTTARHKADVLRAIPRDARVVYWGAPDVRQLHESDRSSALTRIVELKAKAARARKYGRLHYGRLHLSDSVRLAADFNTLAEWLGSELRIELDADHAAMLAAAEEREAEAERRRLAKAAAEAAEYVEGWRNGGDWHPALRGAPTALRLSYMHKPGGGFSDIGEGESWIVQTSHGANIPVAAAKSLWPLIQRARRSQAWRLVPGKSIDVGGYPLTKIREDGSIVVGCHDIAYSEIERIAEQLGLLQTEAEAA